MTPRRKWRSPHCALWIAACALIASGCASWNGPRIDPSGQRILIWPGQTPPVVAPPPGTTAPPFVVPPPGTVPVGAPAVLTTPPPPVITTPPPPPTVGLPTGNLQAPPVYPDAGVPATPPPVITVPSTAPPTTAPIGAPPTSTLSLPPPPPVADAQFAFPAPTIAQAGHPLVLTTLVTRRSDRVPLAGWTVRYEVTGAAAGLSPSGGNRVEVPTDASGRASIEISPLSMAPGEAVVNMVAIAPPELTSATSSPAEVARGTATITWRQGVPGAPAWAPQPGIFTGEMAAPSLDGPPLTGAASSDSTPPPPYSPNDRPPSRFEPPPSLSNNDSDRNAPPRTYAPPPRTQASAGKPELFVEVRRRSPAQVNVGEFASFDVIVTNRGNAPARNIKILDRFDQGLSHIRAQNNELAVRYDTMRDLAPGESAEAALTFGVHRAGELCHEATVTADDAATVVERGCIAAVDNRPVARPAIEVTKQGPTRHYLQELAKFRIVIKNTGDAPVENVVIIDRYDGALEPRYTTDGAEKLSDGSLQWKIQRLDRGERRTFDVDAACVALSNSACSTANVTADGGINIAEQRCVEILPRPAAGTTGPTGPGAAPALPAESLKIRIQSTANPARVGVPASLFVFVENVGVQPQRSVALRVLLPKDTRPLLSQIQPPGSAVLAGDLEVRFDNVGDLGPGNTRQFEIPFAADKAGIVTFVAEAASAGMAKPISIESNPIQIEADAQ